MEAEADIVRLELDTQRREQREFLARLRRDRAFLLQHIRALSGAVCRRLSNRLTMLLSSRHRGVKTWPRWLEARRPIVTSGCTPAVVAANLPTYFCSPSQYSGGAPRSAIAPSATDDPEDYLAGQRWGFLLAFVLEGRNDWHSALQECARWIERNLNKTGRAWEPYSACERVANLLVFLAAAPTEVREEGISPQLTEFLVDSLSWIYRHLEYYGPTATFNHILNNARALVMGGVVTGNAAAIGAGVQIFRNCLPALITSGGFLRERSSHYQLVVLNWLLDAWRFLGSRGAPESEAAELMRGYIERMLTAASLLYADANGLPVTIGDVSPDSPPAQSLARLSFLYPEVWPASVTCLRSVEMRDGWFRVSAGQDVVLGNFPAGAYPPGFPTHGHCDLTSFVWMHCGREVLADSGRFRYTPDAVSLFQQSGAGHNLPVVNGFAPLCETLVANRHWWPLPYAGATLEAFERNGGIVLTHDGFARATPVTSHSRQIIVRQGRLSVTDCFDGRGVVEVAFCWHFGEGFTAFDAAGMAVMGSDCQARLSVEGLSGTPRIEPILGTPPGTWISRVYGQRRPALGIRVCSRVELPASVSTHIQLITGAS